MNWFTSKRKAHELCGTILYVSLFPVLLLFSGSVLLRIHGLVMLTEQAVFYYETLKPTTVGHTSTAHLWKASCWPGSVIFPQLPGVGSHLLCHCAVSDFILMVVNSGIWIQ